MAKRVKGARHRAIRFPLRQVLEQYGLSQYRLSKVSGLAPSYVTRLAQGKTVPVWTTVMRIATSIGADLGDFMPRPPVARPSRSAKSKETLAAAG